MPSVYCGFEDFTTPRTGGEMAGALRDAVARVDRDLALLLVLDPESGGLGIELPTDDDLQVVLDIAVNGGLFSASVFDDIDEGEEGEAEMSGSVRADSVVAPMEIRAVKGDSVVGAYNEASFLDGHPPGRSIPTLLDHARRVLGSQTLEVVLSADHRDVLIEAPDIATLELAAEAVGVSGPPSFAEDLVRVRRDSIETRGRTAPPPNWIPRRPRSGSRSWVATGPVGDVTVVRTEGDPVRIGLAVLDHLDSTGSAAAERIDVSVEPDFSVRIAGSAKDDVQWAADELRRRSNA